MSKESVTNEVANQTSTALAAESNAPMGFEDEDSGDMIIPRVKVIQMLSPERKDGTAADGDIIDSLTKTKYNGKVFVPVFKYNNNLEWKDRADGGGIKCIAKDGKVGESFDGTKLLCAVCKRCEFDNTKQGREAAPKCTKYINFFGFFEGERMPIVLSFGKTNYNTGKQMYSLAKVTMQNMWNHGYILNSKLQAKGGNEWYIITTSPAGATSVEDREFAQTIYKQFRNSIQYTAVDLEGTESVVESAPIGESTEF